MECALFEDHVSLSIDRRSRSSRSAEEELHVTLTGADGPIRLRYRRDLYRKFPVHLSGETVREDTTDDDDWSVYTGMDHQGTVVVRRGADTPSGIELEGFVAKRDKWLTIQPLEGGDHVIHEHIPIAREVKVSNGDSEGDIDDDDDVVNKRDTDHETDDVAKRDDNTPAPDLTRRMDIELKINMDYKLYSRMYGKTRGNFATEAAKRAKCIDLLKQYYVFMISALNIRYQPIRDAGMNLNIVMGGLLISDTVNGSLWTTYDQFENKSFDGRVAMSRFRTWLAKQPVLGQQKADHWQIHSTSGTSWAVVNSMCGTYVSYCNSNFNPVDASTGGHEILHTFGVSHDPGTKECPGWGIMHHTGSASGTFLVTNCTLRELRASLNKRIDNRYSCLLTANSNGEYANVEKYNDVKLGQVYGINEQCYFYNGATWYGWSSIDEKLCNVLWCANGNIRTNMDVYPYTSCADNKWCVLGKCVDDKDAPMLDKTCLNGDENNCWERLRASTLGQCYPGGNLVKPCCKMCPKNKIANTECEYGLSDHRCTLLDCYPGGNKCCADFCATSKTTTIKGSTRYGCEWGDKKNGCKKEQCYNDTMREICCESCPKWKTDNTGCEYGDKKVGCKPHECYLDQQREICCESCPKWKTDDKGGCEYGNKKEHCERKDCYNADGLAKCCESCQKWKINNTECMYGEHWSTSRCASAPDWQCNYARISVPCCIHCPNAKRRHKIAGCTYGDKYYPKTHCSLTDANKKKCYGWWIHNVCCESCPAIANGGTGWWNVKKNCVYGDRIDGCTNQNCTTDTEKHNCCETCAGVKATTLVPSV